MTAAVGAEGFDVSGVLVSESITSLHGMVIAFGVSLSVRGEVVDPAAMLVAVGDVVREHSVEVERSGNVVWFTATRLSTLTDLAPAIADWWQAERPPSDGSVSLRFVGPAGVTEMTYCQPDRAVDAVRHIIETDSGRPYLPGEAPGGLRRLAARLTRVFRSGFTATEVRVIDDGDCLSVAVAGREVDDRPRLIDFQAPTPGSDDYDLDDPDGGYCIVNEDHVPVYRGLSDVRLADRTLHLTLTAEATRSWGLRSPQMKIPLRLNATETEVLRTTLNRILAQSAPWPLPRVDLG